MADRNTAMINFRLNLSKKDDREIYEYIQQFDSPDFKAVLRGGKSNFIKTVLLSYIREIKQEQEAAKALAEQKAQNEELAEMLGARLDESQETLLQILPELMEKVVLEALEGRVITDADLAATLQTAAGTYVADATSAAEGITTAADVTDKTGALPEVSNELPEDALDYFSGL